MLGTVVWPCAGVASKAVARRAAAAAGGMTAWKPLVASFSGCRRSAGAAAPTGSRSKYTYPTVSPEEEKFIVKSPYPEVEIPMMNLADYVWQDVDKRGDDVALVCSLSDRQYTYQMAHDMSVKFGSALRRIGANKYDCVAMVVPNIPEFAIAFMGIIGAGMHVTTLNPTYREEEMARQLENSGTRYVITIGMFLDKIREATKDNKKVEKIIVIGMEEKPADCLSFMEMMIFDDGSLYGKDRGDNPFEDLAALPYSSGTTGPSKGVALTHYNFVANLEQMVGTGITASDGYQEISVCVLPFFHIYGMTCNMLMGLRHGGKIVTVPRFEPEAYLKALATYKPTMLSLVPPLMSFLSTSPLVRPAMHLSSLKTISGGAAPFGPTLIEKFRERCENDEVIFREGFGMTESSPLTHVQFEKGTVAGSCGHGVSNTWAKIVDLETGAALGPDKEGELCVAGPQVMKGYHDNPKATKKTIINGWLHTGDVSKYSSVDKSFFIVDRLKELIKVKGLQVAPSELEDVIRRHPGVLDVAVVGVPDERAGELPRAYVVRKNRNVQEQSIIDFVAERVAPHKKLAAGVMFVETLPKNQTGKILRRELKSQVFKGSFGY